MWVQDPYWNTEFKNLGFCGIDNKDKNNNNCTFKKEYVGYYDSTLNGLDGDANTVGVLYLMYPQFVMQITVLIQF